MVKCHVRNEISDAIIVRLASVSGKGRAIILYSVISYFLRTMLWMAEMVWTPNDTMKRTCATP